MFQAFGRSRIGRLSRIQFWPTGRSWFIIWHYHSLATISAYNWAAIKADGSSLVVAMRYSSTLAENNIRALVHDIAQRKCVLFAGSGLSACAKLPTWPELLEILIAETPAGQHSRPELRRLLKRGRLLEVGEYVKGALNEQRFTQILKDSLTPTTPGSNSRPHKLLSVLPFAAVITTNYDQLLEDAFAAHDGGRQPKVITQQDIPSMGPLLFDSGFFIFKAHGDISRPETLIISARDYQRMHESVAFASILSAILLTKRIVFVGYSLTDPDFRLIIERQVSAFRGYLPEHYAVMTGVGPIEQEVLGRTTSIRIVDYSAKGNHKDLVPFLERLVKEVNESISPKRVAKPAPVIPVQPPRRLTLPQVDLRIKLRQDYLEVSISHEKDQELTAKNEIRLPSLLQISKLLEEEPVRNRIPMKRYEQAGNALATCIPVVVREILQKVPKQTTVVLRLSAELEQFPWEWLRIDEEFLLLRHPVIRAPIGIADPARGYASPKPPIKVLVIADDSKNFLYAKKEAHDISNLYPSRVQVVRLIGRDASPEKVAREIRSKNYDIIHYAGDGWFDAQESYLELSDQSVLRASELRSLLSPKPPAILVLNSHYTAFLPMKLQNSSMASAGNRRLQRKTTNVTGKRGFTRVAVSSGVGAFVGCFGNPSDKLARVFGRQLHLALANGRTIAHALHEARQIAAREGGKMRDASWLVYTMTGYPELRLAYK